MKKKSVTAFSPLPQKGKSSATVNLDSAQSNDQATLQLEPKTAKSGYFDDLLKKYGIAFLSYECHHLGGFCQTATQSDVQNDITRIREALA